MKKFLGVIVVLILVIALLGSCGGGTTKTSGTSGTTDQSSSSSSTPAPAAVQAPAENFTVLEHKATTDSYGYTTISGKVKNNTDKEWAYVQIEISTFDKDGNQIGSALDNINNLGAGATWGFKAMALEKGVTKYEIKEVGGW